MKLLIPDTIASRTLLVLIVGLTVSHLLSVSLYNNDRSGALIFARGKQTGIQITTIQRLVENAQQAQRQRIVEHADHPRLHVILSQESKIEDRQVKESRADMFRDALVSHLNVGGGQVFKLRYTGGSAPEAWQAHMRQNHPGDELGQTMMLSLQLLDGNWLNFATPVDFPKFIWSIRFVLSIGVMLLAVSVFSLLVVRHLTKPLKMFAYAAGRLGRDVNAPLIPEIGPAEVRQSIRAFNQMHDRMRRFIEDRTQMLAAISHDLGTPITRLRLRAELIEDEDQKTKILTDLDDMEKMVSSALSFARNEATIEPHEMVDINTLLQRVCDDMTDAGHEIILDIGDEAVPLACRPTALRRALTNLIDNAIKYGGQARVSLDNEQDKVLVRIDDNGPGIPEEFLEDAFKPFRRLDPSRSQDTGGTGLGLTIARTIIRAHGGDVKLRNRPCGGLQAEIVLPRA